MRVAFLHNSYRWHGGEDVTFAAEAALLRSHGHEVVEKTTTNEDLIRRGRLATALGLWRGAWSREAYREVREFVRDAAPDVVHVHNFWFRFSPSVLAAAHDGGFPVVLRLPNFRLICPGGVFLDRRGRVCMKCVGRSPWKGAIRRCYHGSFLASAAVARMIAWNRRRGTWERDVDLFVTPSEFSKGLFIRANFPADRIQVKPNFVEPPPSGAAESPRRPDEPKHLLFAGRLSEEKGLRTLISALLQVEAETGAGLRIVGDGPLRRELCDLGGSVRVSEAGDASPDRIFEEIAKATAVIVPSECPETFGRVVIEAFACGRPVVASRIGALAELVRDGETGLLFEPGDAEDLAAKLIRLLRDDDLRERLGCAGRAEYLAKYTPEENYQKLIACYERAAERRPLF